MNAPGGLELFDLQHFETIWVRMLPSAGDACFLFGAPTGQRCIAGLQHFETICLARWHTCTRGGGGRAPGHFSSACGHPSTNLWCTPALLLLRSPNQSAAPADAG